MIITKFAFRNLFTFTERVTMETAAQSNAQIKVLVDDILTASSINLGKVVSLVTGSKGE